MACEHITQKQCPFQAFDHNGDNFIDFNEIKATMHFLGESVSDEDVRSMIAEADVDHNGLIDFYGKIVALQIGHCTGIME